jgi:hypothetical protein
MKQRQRSPLTIVTDEDVTREAFAQAARGQAAQYGPRIEAEQRRVATRKAARRDLYSAVERLVDTDEQARKAADVLRADPAPGRDFPHPRTRAGSPPMTDLFRATPGEEEVLLFTSEHYQWWRYGSVGGSSFDDSAWTDMAFSVASDDGDPDSPTAASGFWVALQTSEHINFLNISPLLNYQYSNRLTSSTSWLGDGSANGRVWFEMVVRRDGEPVTDWAQYPIWQDAVDGWSTSAENDGWVTDWTIGFEMEPGVPYVVEVGLWANCDSSCTLGACGGASLDQWCRLIWVRAAGTVLG